jgi:hypothetical protein
VRDLVRIILVNAIQSQPGEASGLRLIEIGISQEPSTEDKADDEKPDHVHSTLSHVRFDEANRATIAECPDCCGPFFV